MRPQIASTLLVSTILTAQDPAPPSPQDPLDSLRAELAAARAELEQLRALAAEPASAVSGALGLDFTTHYFFRGILQEDQGVIGQPWLELGYQLLAGDDLVRSVDLRFGSWNSLHDGPTGGSGGVWYESDAWASLSCKLGDRLTVGTTFTIYDSPNGAFGTVEEQALSVGFDDAGLLLCNGLRPALLLAFELDGQADAGGDAGVYAQVGVEPSFDLGGGGGFAFQLELPVRVGLSLDDYYEAPGGGGDEWFGYLDVGVALTTTLPWVPRSLGPWQATVGLHFLALGDSNEARNAGDSSEWTAALGLRTTF